MACALHFHIRRELIVNPARGADIRSLEARGPEEDAMQQNPLSPAIRSRARRATEVYCRRDNRVYAVCPHVAAGSRCRCLSEVETADALFESETDDKLGH
ncbi:MAG TPA: hypothetical protein VER38_00145 [Candidatus Eisenbacteria bacterium]|nr:hypothetical protein [Candidatus Eisenbacteria bacterium]